MVLTVSGAITSIAEFMTIVFIFLFVLVITFLTTRYIAAVQKKTIVGGNMEIIETIRLSGNKYLQIIKVSNKYLCIAVCKDTITMLVELDENEIKEVKSNQIDLDFSQLLEKMKKKAGFTDKETNEGNRP